MLDKDGISERNQKLVNFVAGLELGIHVIDLPEKPRFVSANYDYLLNGFVKNFKIMLFDREFGGDMLLECRVDDDPNEHRERFVEWMSMYEHKRIYTVSYGDLFLCGFNHHDKINKRQPYPVFSRFFPHFYYDLERANDIKEKFSEYDLRIN